MSDDGEALRHHLEDRLATIPDLLGAGQHAAVLRREVRHAAAAALVAAGATADVDDAALQRAHATALARCVAAAERHAQAVLAAPLADALEAGRHRTRFCTPSILHEVLVDTTPFRHETSLSDGALGSTTAGDGVFTDVEDGLSQLLGGMALPFADGSTGAIRALVEWIATWHPAPLVGVNRIAHKAVVHALEAHRVPWYHLDEGSWTAELDAAGPPDPATIDVRPGTTHVWVNSATYEGALTDVEGIANRLTDDQLLLVDEAWGAHFGYHPGLGPPRAIDRGAAVMTTSVHKQGGGRQGTALLVASRTRLDAEQLATLTATVRGGGTTSPSFPLLASVDAAVRHLHATGGRPLCRARRLARTLQDLLAALDHVVAQVGSLGDPLKLLVRLRTVDGTTADGFAVAEALADAGIVVERPGFATLLLLVPFQVDLVDVHRLAEALVRLQPPPAADHDRRAGTPFPVSDRAAGPTPPGPVEAVPLTADSAPVLQGRLAADLVAAYPPGIPVVCPGDRLTADQVGHLLAVHRAGGTVTSAAGRRRGIPHLYCAQEPR